MHCAWNNPNLPNECILNKTSTDRLTERKKCLSSSETECLSHTQMHAHTPAALIKKMGDLPWQRGLVSAASHVRAAGCRHKESL